MGCLASFAASEDTGAGMPWGGCEKVLAPAGEAAMGGGGESGQEDEAGVFARLTDDRGYPGS